MGFRWFLDERAWGVPNKGFLEQLLLLITMMIICFWSPTQLFEPNDILPSSKMHLYSLDLCSFNTQINMPSSDSELVSLFIKSGKSLDGYVKAILKNIDLKAITDSNYNVEFVARLVRMLQELHIPTSLIFPFDQSDDYNQIVKRIDESQNGNTPGILQKLMTHHLSRAISLVSHIDLPREFLVRVMDEQGINFDINNASLLYYVYDQFKTPNLSRLDAGLTIHDRNTIQEVLSEDPYPDPYVYGAEFKFNTGIVNQSSSFDPQSNKQNFSSTDQNNMDTLQLSLATTQAEFDVMSIKFSKR